LHRNVRATTHWEDISEFQRRYPSVDVASGVRWIDARRIVTSAGISAGIDMCLHVVERLCGRDLAAMTARQMDYALTETPALH